MTKLEEAVALVIEKSSGPWHDWKTTNHRDPLIDRYYVSKEAFENLMSIYMLYPLESGK